MLIRRIHSHLFAALLALAFFSLNALALEDIGRSGIIDQLIQAGKIPVSEISNKWESFILQTVSHPLPGVDRAQRVSGEFPPESRDAFYELVLFPAKASADLNAMYLAAAKNILYAKQGRASANDSEAQTHDNLGTILFGQVYLFNAGKVEVVSTVGATLSFLPGCPLRYAVSFDDETPQVIMIVPANFNATCSTADWSESVKNNCLHILSTHTLAAAGYHTLKIWMVDPAVAMKKIVVNTGGVKPSYLGPPESFYRHP